MVKSYDDILSSLSMNVVDGKLVIKSNHRRAPPPLPTPDNERPPPPEQKISPLEKLRMTGVKKNELRKMYYS